MKKLRFLAIFLYSSISIAIGVQILFHLNKVQLDLSELSRGEIKLLAIVAFAHGLTYFVVYLHSMAFPRGMVLNHGASVVHIGDKSIAVLDPKRNLAHILNLDAQTTNFLTYTMPLRRFQKMTGGAKIKTSQVVCYRIKNLSLEPIEGAQNQFAIVPPGRE